jgi:hypothetical protein
LKSSTNSGTAVAGASIAVMKARNPFGLIRTNVLSMMTGPDGRFPHEIGAGPAAQARGTINHGEVGIR